MQQHVVSSTKRHWLRSPANNVKHLSICFFPTCICRLNKLFISRRCIHYVLQYVPAKQQQQHVVEGFVTKVGKGCTHTLHGTTLPCVCKKKRFLRGCCKCYFCHILEDSFAFSQNTTAIECQRN